MWSLCTSRCCGVQADSAMQCVADLHLHSKYSRAVSGQMVPSQMAYWAARKGIKLIATGDWTHPLWLRELESGLEEAGEGVYKLNDRFGEKEGVFFLLSTELSCIYKQGDRVRKIHILVLVPSFDVAERVSEKLRMVGVNLMSDGRPIMGLSARSLTELVLGVDENCLLIPAHAWTPHFSVFGSIGGFDSLEECFGEYSKYIYAVETGLSSDPGMNWRVKELDGRNILSFSDAHSPSKLGREATVFEIPGGQLSYEAIYQAIAGPAARHLHGEPPANKHGAPAAEAHRRASPAVAYTIEFYPEEGKYHLTGHRNCGVKYSPGETKKLGSTCPVCGKKLTIGVMHRVEELADEKSQEQSTKFETDDFRVRWVRHPEEKRPPFVMLVPLQEILSEVLGSGVSSKSVQNEYERLVSSGISEFDILLKTDLLDIERFAGVRLREAIEKVRCGNIFIDPGYDGVFGKVKIWGEVEKPSGFEQTSLF